MLAVTIAPKPLPCQNGLGTTGPLVEQPLVAHPLLVEL